MHRRWALVAGALLVLVALFFLLREDLDPDGPVGGGDTLEEMLDATGAAAAPGSTPRLAGGAREAPVPPAGPDQAPGAQAAAPAGPADFVVVSHETASPLENIALEDEDGALLASTDEEGHARIEQVPGTGIVLYARGKGYLPLLARARPGDRRELALRPGISVTGRIVRAGQRGNPGEATISVWDVDLKSTLASFSTDESGTFELNAVRPNRPFLMTVRLAGLVPQIKRLVLDVPTKDLDVVVGEGGHLTGRVQNDSDAPLEGLEVRLLRPDETILEQRLRSPGETRVHVAHLAAHVASTRTDEEGRYGFHGVPIDTDVQPVVLAGGRHVVRGKPARFQEVGQTLERDMLVSSSARMRIRLSDEGGKPIGDADIEVQLAGGVWQVQPKDERKGGAILLRDLTPGPFRLTITRPGTPTLREEGVLVAGEESHITLTVPRGRKVRGKVEDKRGAPIWKALVSWHAGGERVEVRTERDGRFRFRNLTQDQGTVLVRARDLPLSAFAYEDRSLPDVKATGPALRITLKDGTRVRGSFRDLAPDREVRSSMVPGTRFDDVRLALDREFRFVRRGPLPNQAPLFIFQTRGRPPILRRELTPFRSEEKRDLGPLFFEATNPRKGRVLDEQGLPIWAAKVTLRTSWSQATARTDRKGDFLFAHMPRRPLDVIVEAEGYPTTPLILKTSSEFKPQVIVLRRMIDVTFQVTRAGRPIGRAVPLTIVGLTKGAGGGGRSTLKPPTDTRGQLRTRLAPGRYRITARDKKTGAAVTREIDLTNEPQQRVRLEVR